MEKDKEYYKKKYGVISEEQFEQLPIFRERKETKIGQIFRIEEKAKLDTFNNLAFVKADRQSPWGYVIEMKIIWVEETK